MAISDDACAEILINDLNSMLVRIEALPAHPRYTDALEGTKTVRDAVCEGRVDLHQRAMKARFAALDSA